MIPSSIILGARERVIPSTPCFEVPYSVSFGKGYTDLDGSGQQHDVL